MSGQLGPAGVVVSGFGFRYASRRQWAISDVDFRIEPGERILLTGPSGAGKSTLLSAMSGLLGPDAGDARGKVLVDGAAPVRARDRIGILFQDPDSQLVMSRAGDDVAFALENRGIPPDEIWPRVRTALDAVGFGYGLDRSTQTLSGGEKQRLVLAGAMVGAPGLLLLDEPTSQLDPDGARLVRDAVATILADRETTLVLIDHDAGPWLPLIDRVLDVRFGPTQGGPQSKGSTQGRPESVGTTQGRPQSMGTLPERRPPAHSGGSLNNPPADAVPDHPLRAARVGFSYPGEHYLRPALAPTDVELTAGQVTAITGPNGSGKSTLGLLLAGLKEPSVGHVLASPQLAGSLGERPPHRWRAHDLVHRIGTVFQNPEHQFLTGRVRDELSLGPLRAGAGNHAAHDRAEELLVRLGLTAYAEANPFTLSGGQQRRLSVAAALATRPSVLILDEPTFGQDPVTWEELVRLLAEARDDGAALCLISHDARLVAGFADHAVHLGRSSSGDPVADDQQRSGGSSGARPATAFVAPDDQPETPRPEVAEPRPPSDRPPAERAQGWLTRLNPVAQIVSVLLIAVTALATIDLLTPAILVAAELSLLPAAGLIRPATLLARTWPLLLSAAGVAWVNLLFSAGSGWDWAGSAALALRVIAVALPGVLFVASTDPVRVADALTVHWRVSTRFAYGALAAIRLAPLLVTEWQAIRLARRARGVDAGRNPVTAVRLFAGAAFTLLVGAIRRGSRLSAAMDARGFDSSATSGDTASGEDPRSGAPVRTNARGSVLHRRDYLFVAVVVLLCSATTAVTVAAGLWRPVFAG